ncbi:MAG: hypothetical protein JWQ63_4176 [Mucilaginibacter sp.]|nr:hypothetical protein [Mucilaginibacter sp.]
MSDNNSWQQSEKKAFWRDIAPDDHVVQIYENDDVLLNTLAYFVGDGFNADGSVIVIATPDHLKQLDELLLKSGFNLDILIAKDQYIPVDAAETLSKFMVNGWPDEKYFMETAVGLMKRAQKNGGQIRAFGEMVALLWERGDSSAAIHLEQLWNKLCAVEDFCLFCAYPKSAFINDASASIMHVCTAHSKIIAADENLDMELQYKYVS